jgi:hypothetical protein
MCKLKLRGEFVGLENLVSLFFVFVSDLCNNAISMSDCIVSNYNIINE